MELCEMSLMEVEDFLDEKRTHMGEGIIMVEQVISSACNILGDVWIQSPASMSSENCRD